MGTTLRVGLLVAGIALSLASANQNQQNRKQPPPPSVGGDGAPQPQPMDDSLALGLWKSSFGAVKVERDDSHEGHLMGVWVYERGGQEVVGFFSGPVSGNVLTFKWQEPNAASGPPLRGGGYLVFDQQGGSFEGRWWTQNRDRGGDWKGWRAPGTTPGAAPSASEPDPAAAEPAPGPAEQAPPQNRGGDDYI